MHYTHLFHSRGPRQASLALFGILIGLTSNFLPSTHGASRFWDGSANGNFSTAANWVGGVAPVAGDDLVFQTGVTQLLVTNNFSPNRAWNSILFQGSNYFVRGNAILVTNGISSINPVGANHIDADVDVRASQPWEASGALASLDINGDINLNANTLTVRANTGDFFFSGIISGTGNLVKTNVGTLRMDGAGHNTYAGFTRFDGGVLELDKFTIFPTFTNFTAIPSDLTIGDGNGLIGTDVLRLLADDQIANTSDVTVKNSGLFDLNGHDDHIGSLTMQGGTVDSGGGVLFLGGNLTTLADANTAFINGHLSLGGASRTFDVNSGPPSADLRINAVISSDTAVIFATAGFTKTGDGSLFLAGTNTYNGITTINEGQVALLADRALGATVTLLGASAGTVVNGSGNLFLSGVQVTNEDLTINSSNPGGAFNASGASVWTGDILLNTDTFISSSSSLLLNGQITGTGGFTKLSGGSLRLAGTNANTYAGTTTVRDGTLFLDKDTTKVIDGAMSGPLVIGEDELPENTDVVRYLACCQLPDDTDITINASGLLDLNGFGENVRNIIFNGGDLDTAAAGSILPTGDITVNANTNSQAIISGRMSVLSNPIINASGHFFSPDLRIDAQLHGAGGFVKNGVGEVGLTSSNIFTGPVTLNDGFVLVDDSFALGSTAGGTVVHNGAVLALRFSVHVPAESLMIEGTGQSLFGAVSSSFGSNSWAGNITLTSNATIYVDAGDFLNISGSITGNFDITKTGTGTLIFSGGTANDFDDMFVDAGTLVLNKSIANAAGPADLTIGDGLGTDIVRLANDNQIADTTKVHLSLGGRLDMNDMNETTGAIDGRGGIIDLGTGVLREGADNASSTFGGLIIGSGDLFKLGLGTWTLTGNNTYSGQTTVSAGTLVINGSQEDSPVTVNGTATLEGRGTIGDLHVFGSLRPGTSPGILTSSNLAFSPLGDYFVELNGPDPGTGYDQLSVRGTNQLGGSTLHVSVGTGFAPFEGEEFVIINNDGADGIQGTFAGLANGSIITANNLQFRIRYFAIFENDVVLTLVNTAAGLVSATVSGGNGDGNIDVNECNFISVVITNTTGGTLSGVTGTLIPKTPGICVTVGSSAYPTMAANARATNSTPFQFSVGPNFVCGTNANFDLVVETPADGTFSIPISLPTGSAGTAVRFNNNIVTAIPDSGSVDLPVTVSGITTPIKRVTVSLHITHTTDSDLDISLIGPDGTTVVLSSDNGGSASNYGTDCVDRQRTVFADSAGTAITAGTAPFEGVFRPEQSLAAFNEKFGADANGTWRLRVADDTAGGVGSVRCWSLFVSPTACSGGGGACESCPEDSVIHGLLGVGSLVQTNRLVRDGTNSTCALVKVCPGVTGALGDRFYDAYTFVNGESNACITVTLDADCNLFSATYTNAYDPFDLCLNYLADCGLSTTDAGGMRTYSFQMAAQQQFVVVVHGVDPGDACGYTLSVDGGSCRPRLFINPVAGNRVALDWTTAAVGYSLEQTNALSDPPHPLWLPVPGTPTITGGRFHVIDPIALPPTNNFYQLRKP
jgi:autotransporter-associated beta strand protein